MSLSITAMSVHNPTRYKTIPFKSLKYIKVLFMRGLKTEPLATSQVCRLMGEFQDNYIL